MGLQILRYLAWIALFLLFFPLFGNSGLRFGQAAYPAGDLFDKRRFYGAHAREFDLIFLGDSRTFCGIDPVLIDKELGTRSYNLSHMAHWFPNQLAQFRELVDVIPAGTAVVWSIGNRNFLPVHDALNRTYAISPSDVPEYLDMGFGWRALEDNVLFFAADRGSLRFLPGFTVYANRKDWRLKAQEIFDRPVAFLPEASAPAEIRNMQAAERLREEYRRDASVKYMQYEISGDEVTSLTLLRERGNYVRVEIDGEFFRARQAEHARTIAPAPAREFEADPAYWNVFAAVIELFKRKGIKLIVNELEEAPYHYTSAPWRDDHNRFMAKVRRYVEDARVPYVRAELEQLSNADYFDFNHLNSVGIARYAPLLAARLKPVLAGGESKGAF